MNKYLLFLLFLLLPVLSPAQEINDEARKDYDKGYEYFRKMKYEKAAKYFQKAADMGYSDAQYMLGYLYDSGGGVTQDYHKAFEFFQKAALQGNAKAQYNLGMLYEDGYGVEQNYTIAVEWYQKAANQGYSPSQHHLAVMYEEGRGVDKDFTRSIEWYQKIADKGKSYAKEKIATLRNEMESEKKNQVPRDSALAEKEYVEGCKSLGSAEAVEWFEKSAQHGDLMALVELGYIYENALGVERDYKKAFEYYNDAAIKGLIPAQVALGDMYLNGKGVTQDNGKALYWYQKAVDKNAPIAQNKLGYMYEKGYGVEKNYIKALDLYQKASDSGSEDAQRNLAYLRDKMKSEKLDTAHSNTNQQQKQTITAKNTSIVKKEPAQGIVSKVEPKEEMVMVDTDIPVISRVNRNTFAIIIANEDYMDEAKVDFAKNDGEVFKNYCHKTLGLPETNIHYLPNATLAKMFGELDWLRQVCEVYKGEANVIFYYSGHGFPDEKSHAAYIIPVDGNKRLLRTCFSVSELYEMLGSMPSKRVTVLMDACFSGAKRSGDMLASAKGVAIKVKYGAPKGNMVVMAAAQGDETAYFNKEAKHGLFTYYLLKKLKETKGSVTLGDLSSYIQDEVSKYSIVVNGKSQTPSVQASDKLAGSWRSLNF